MASRMTAVHLVLFAAVALASSAPAASVTYITDAIGLGFRDAGGGFGASPVPALLRSGRIAGGIDPGDYRAAFEFNLTAIPALATVTSARLVINSLAPPVQRGREVLSAYFGDGVITASDVSLTLESLVLSNGAIGNTSYDVTGILQGFYAIGAPWLGFTAFQSPIGQCAEPFFGSCSTAYFGPGVEGPNGRPQLVVEYTPFVPPPEPSVPEPATWATLITGLALTGAALRRRRRAAV